MISVEIVYHSALAHGDPLAAEGVVLGHRLDLHRPRLNPVAQIADLVDSPGPEAITVLRQAGEGGRRGGGGRQPGGPVALAILELDRVGGHASSRIVALLTQPYLTT